MSGVGKTTAARQVARAYDLRLYSLDSQTYAHESQLPPDTKTADERWVESSPDSLADWFEDHARQRFQLVIDDLLRLPDDAPVIADGPQLLPELVGPRLAELERAIFIVADSALQRELVMARGSLTYAQTRDPERALANRVARDAILAERLARAAAERNLSVVEVHAVEETRAAMERQFNPFLTSWVAVGDRGEVGTRRRDENDARLRQWRAYAERVPEAATKRLALACECDRPGCTALVTVGLAEAESARADERPLLADH
jgi:hypothetical protein